MKRSYGFVRPGIILMMSLLLCSGCMRDEIAAPADDALIKGRSFFNPAGHLPPTQVYGLSADNRLVRLMAGPPATVVGSVALSGMNPGERMLAIDIRPSTRELFGVSDSSVLYRIDPMSAVATPVGSKMNPVIMGEMVGFDFDPTKDLITLVTNRGQNLTIDPSSGIVTTVGNTLNQELEINSIAYLNKAVYDPTIRLVDINTADGRLYAQDVESGTTVAMGFTGLVITGEGGFDISRDNRAFAVLNARTANGVNDSTVRGDNTSNATTRLYLIDFRSGKATSLGPVGNLIGIAVP